jgi:hypothetical protein
MFWGSTRLLFNGYRASDEVFLRGAEQLGVTATIHLHLLPPLPAMPFCLAHRQLHLQHIREATHMSSWSTLVPLFKHNLLKRMAAISVQSSSIPQQSLLLTFWHRSFTFNSNKSPTWCNNVLVYYPDICLQLNMFRAFFRPSSGAQWLPSQPLVLPSYRGDSRAGRLAGPTKSTAWLSPRHEGKTRGCHCSHWAPDDGRENARNMLSCKQTSG